jgi:hypothetical protein
MAHFNYEVQMVFRFYASPPEDRFMSFHGKAPKGLQSHLIGATLRKRPGQSLLSWFILSCLVASEFGLWPTSVACAASYTFSYGEGGDSK